MLFCRVELPRRTAAPLSRKPLDLGVEEGRLAPPRRPELRPRVQTCSALWWLRAAEAEALEGEEGARPAARQSRCGAGGGDSRGARRRTRRSRTKSRLRRAVRLRREARANASARARATRRRCRAAPERCCAAALLRCLAASAAAPSPLLPPPRAPLPLLPAADTQGVGGGRTARRSRCSAAPRCCTARPRQGPTGPTASAAAEATAAVATASEATAPAAEATAAEATAAEATAEATAMAGVAGGGVAGWPTSPALRPPSLPLDAAAVAADAAPSKLLVGTKIAHLGGSMRFGGDKKSPTWGEACVLVGTKIAHLGGSFLFLGSMYS